MVPGRISFCSPSPRVSRASATVGTACSFAQRTSSCLPLARLIRPLATIAPTTATASTPAITRRLDRGLPSNGEDIGLSCVWTLNGVAAVSMDEAEQGGHEDQRRQGREQEATDHGAAE